MRNRKTKNIFAKKKPLGKRFASRISDILPEKTPTFTYDTDYRSVASSSDLVMNSSTQSEAASKVAMPDYDTTIDIFEPISEITPEAISESTLDATTEKSSNIISEDAPKTVSEKSLNIISGNASKAIPEKSSKLISENVPKAVSENDISGIIPLNEFTEGIYENNIEELSTSPQKKNSKAKKSAHSTHRSFSFSALMGKIAAGISCSFSSLKNALTRNIKKTVACLSAGAVGVAALTVVAVIIVNSNAIGISVAGNSIGYVPDEKAYDVLVEDVIGEISNDNMDAEIIIEESKIALAEINPNSKSEYIDKEELKQTLIESGAVKANAYAVLINGTPLTYLTKEDDAMSLQDGILNTFTGGNPDVKYEWLDDFKIENTTTSLNNLATSPQAIDLLLTGGEEIKRIKVNEGDTISGIAAQNKITISELKEANPDLSIDKIKPGDTISLNKPEPYIHLQTTAIETKKEKIKYKKTEEKTGELYEDEKKIKTKGIKGEKEVTNEVVYLNGEVIKETELSATVLSEPKDEIVLVGTKRRSTYSSGGYSSGSGALGRPIGNMEISSPFGGSRNHTAVDFRAPKGTPIYAAASGKVISVGFEGTYGNIVKINHGNGMQTYYAHCDQMNVRAGQSVRKGQQIATVGITGRATGYHLHFQVMVNGSPRNPMGYL